MLSKKIKKPCSKKYFSINSILIIFTSIIVIFLAIFNVYYISNKISENDDVTGSQTLVQEVKRLKYWPVVILAWNKFGNLRSMNRVFKSLGYEFVNASNNDEWNFLWSIETPLHQPNTKSDPLFANVDKNSLRQDQKINHFPGINSLVSKSFMNEINSRLKYILPSFVLPEDTEKLKQFLHNNPNAKLVEKDLHNRGVKIVEKKDIKYERSEVFYQQFLDKPFLIDGHAFDFGVFVLITSFDPVRIYRFHEDMLFRFCPKKYHPFDPANLKKYVVEDGSLPAYVMPTFEKIYKQYRCPVKEIFENLIQKKGFDVTKLWKEIDKAIVSIVLNTESFVLRRTESFGHSTKNFFELVRFDIMFDENLNPFVMEVNMSPNMTPAKKIDEEHVMIYEQMIYNAIEMVGGGSYYEFMSRFNDSDTMISNEKNIAANFKLCLKHKCHESCVQKQCDICKPCITPESRYHMREAFREHKYQGNFHRVFPTRDYFNDKKFYNSMTQNNQISLDWFKAKCLQDEKWC